ncbi:MAG: hypothetical protein LUO85_00595 [Methanomassiliicoccales archaeon]|nr:hypothetical protein [Methanomassiliicoccales archaeon]
MKDARAEEYKEHFEHMESTLKGLPEWPADDVRRQADLAMIHAAVDESLNMSRMLLKDLGHELGDDEANLVTLQDEFILTDAMMDKLRAAIAFRDQTLSESVELDGVILTEKIEQVKYTLLELMDLFKEVLEDDLAD